jgi:hypothetical protein
MQFHHHQECSMRADVKARNVTAILVKGDPNSPAIVATGRDAIAIKAGTIFNGCSFDVDTPIPMRSELIPGANYGIIVGSETVEIENLLEPPTSDFCLGGFHFAPGGNASARSGGDTVPAINPFSVWDLNFRPACPDPWGMVLVESPGRKFWCDIYLLGVNHLAGGTSQFGATIADGYDPPEKLRARGGHFANLNYNTALAVMNHHGKGLLGIEEFFAAAFGVTERTSRRSDPCATGLDAPHTSKFGVMQATGNMWTWGHDGDPDEPQASLFGGSWVDSADSGSRASYWLRALVLGQSPRGARPL